MPTAATARLLSRAAAAGLVLLAAPVARADDITALYQANWGGLAAAHIRLSLHDGPGGYRNEISVSSQGMPHMVTRFRGTAIAEGSIAGQAPLPTRYDASYDLRKRKNSQLRMIFVSRPGATVAERGPGDTSKKPQLADEFRRNVMDPLSAITQIRQAVLRGETNFTVHAYDGARRFDVVARVLPRNPSEPGIHLEMLLKAIAGFKGESSDEGDPDDAPRVVEVTLSDDARLLPLALSVPIWYLPLDVSLARVCETDTACNW